MSSKVEIIILQYNNSGDTLKCLESVNKLNYSDFGVVVVDNNSQPEHIERAKNKVAELGSRFYFLQSDNNLGYSGGNNLGIKRALENSADYILILNNDTTLPPDTLSRLVKRANESDFIGILTPALDEGDKVAYGGKIKWLASELAHNYQFDKPEIGPDIWGTNIYIPGTAMLIKRKVFEKIGFLDERYFLYFEDADFSVRAANAGLKLIICPEISIKHLVSSTTKSLGSPLLLRYHFRNAHLFNFLRGPFWVKILLPFWSLWIIMKQAIKLSFFPSKREISRSILNGVIDFYRGKFGKINV